MELDAFFQSMRIRMRPHENTHILLMIKLTSILLLACCLQLSAKSYGQRITLSKTNAPLQEVFLDIYRQTGYYFMCKDNLLESARKVDIQVKDATLLEVLDICFRNQPLDYSISDHVIVVSRKASPPLINVSGKVVNEKGEALPGTNISIKNSNILVATVIDGSFSLHQVDNESILVVSRVGYETQEFPLHGNKEVTIHMVLSVSSLDQVQIIAYGTTTRRLDIGDISSVSAETISQQPVSDPLQALEGRAPGLQITQTSGVPGSAITVLIRGQNSIANGNNPLYVIDGVPFTANSISSGLVSGGITVGGSPLSSMNPADIESIEILKDADATSIYGSRGANGVILITTKMGKPGKTAVDLNIYSGSSVVTQFMPVLNTPQYLKMRREAFNNDAQQPNIYSDYDLLVWDTTRYTDWQKSLFGQTANITNVQGSVSGGNLNTKFILGGSYNRQTTVFPGSFNDQKGTGHVGITHTSANQRFKLNFTALYSSENNYLPSIDNISQALTLPPDTPPVYDSSGKLNWANGTFTNPYAVLLSYYKSTTHNLLGNIVLNYELLPHLNIKLSGGYSNLNMDEVSVRPLTSIPPAFHSTSGHSFFSTQSLDNWIIEPQIEFTNASKYGSVSVLAGTTFQQNLLNGQTLLGTGFSSDELLTDIGAASHITQEGVNQSEYRYEALFGRISYNWKEKYLINLTGRRDGSSRFGPNRQFANFGSVAAGWIFSKEPFISKNLPALSFGKIRSSYGTSGNDQIGDYQYLDSWTPVFYNYQSVAGLQPVRLNNPDYSWELNRKWEVGMELGFLKERIYFTSSYYQNRSSNQLVGYPLPLITGFSSVQQNLAATVQNTGWEFVLTTRNIVTKNFSWTTNFNLTIPRNKLISYPGLAESPYAGIYEIGKSLNLYTTTQATGVDPKTGLYTFTDADHDGNISFPADWFALKSIEQQYYGGFNNMFQYKNFQATIFFQYVKQTGKNYLFGNYVSPGMFGNQAAYVLNPWQKPGDEKSIQQYTQSYGPAFSSYANEVSSDQAISDASFIRLKNISVSYQFSAKTLSSLHLQLLRIYIQGQNLVTFTHFMGLDPENQSHTSIPPLKTLTAGVQITF
jgi:TonB-dependent starch-binding outer membrane protein SusC